MRMPRIKLLPDEVASQVAAGEVVERPASVVKELVENALDAGADRVEIMIRGGGASLIRVVDNGCGMDRDDALLCLERHATSKIRTGADLATISTLGFRGEAVPSIASVSKFRLGTRERGAEAGTEVLVNGGRIEAVRDSGDAPGTSIEVRSLFYNLPARRKFLRTEATETSHVEHQFTLQALGRPDVAFVLMNGDRVVHQLPAVSGIRERVRDLFGKELDAELLEVPAFDERGISVRGLIGRAGVSRSSRDQQYTFLNGRAVENAALSQGLREGYHTALMKGQHPVAFLFLQIDPAEVDVNVHPAKREVRFRDPLSIRGVIERAVRGAIETDRAAWSAAFSSPQAPRAVAEAEGTMQIGFSGLVSSGRGLRRDEVLGPKQVSLAIETKASVEDSSSLEASATVHASAVDSLSEAGSDSEEPRAKAVVGPTSEVIEDVSEHAGERHRGETLSGEATPPPEARFRILGVIGRLYVVMENDQGMVLVDQHAAHERVLYEQMVSRMRRREVPSQRLLIPLILRVTPRDGDWLRGNAGLLESAGIMVEEFGPNAFKVDALPSFLMGEEAGRLVPRIVDELRSASSGSAKLRLGEDVIAKTVCRHAIKANDALAELELRRLIEDLLACELPYCCPHGRPTMIQMGFDELEKRFGRRV
ncbi:MAG: mismatch repair endonuclease MutL [Verrucomicrobiota bacterium]